MVNKLIAHNPISLEERIKIQEGLLLDLTYSKLAEYVSRPKSTVMREAKRLGDIRKYDPHKAQKDFEDKQKNIGKKKK